MESRSGDRGVISGLLAAGIGTPFLLHAIDAERAGQPNPKIATEAQSREILQAIQAWRSGRPPAPAASSDNHFWKRTSVVLLDARAMLGGRGIGNVYANPSCGSVVLDERIMGTNQDAESRLPVLPKKLRQELILANRIPGHVADPRLPGIVYAPVRTVRDIFRARPDGWHRFDEAFPNARSYYQTSRAVLTDDGQHALVYVAEGNFPSCGNGSLYYLMSVGGHWSVSVTETLWGGSDRIF